MKKLDILFVSETSDELDHDRMDVAAQIQTFLSGLPSGGDYRVGVMLGHACGSYSGSLYTAGHTGPVLDSKQMSLSAIGQEAYFRLTHVPRDEASNGGEAGMYSLWKSLTTNLTTIRNQGFYRTDAGLAVVFISANNDIDVVGGPDSAGLPTEMNQARIDAWNLYYKDVVTAQTLYNKLKQVKGSQPLRVGGILCPENKAPRNLINLMGSNGFVGTLGNPGSISSGLSSINGMIMTGSVQTHFLLRVPSSRLDRGSIRVYVNGVRVTTWTYDPSDSSINLASCTPGLTPCACITIIYCEPR